MYFLQCEEWMGPHKDNQSAYRRKETKRLVTVASDKSTLEEALAELRKYQAKYNKRYYPHTQVEFTLLGVQIINESVNSEMMAYFNLFFVSDLL